jgi:hypothetical protein
VKARLAATILAPPLVLTLAAPPLAAQGTFRIVVDSVAESRSRTASNDLAGRLTLMPKLEGEGLGEAKAFRIRVTAAQDDTGQSLLPEESAPAPWEESATAEGLWIRLASPARGAASVTVSGTVDLWVPKRDATRSSPTKKSIVSVPFELKDVPLP